MSQREIILIEYNPFKWVLTETSSNTLSIVGLGKNKRLCYKLPKKGNMLVGDKGNFQELRMNPSWQQIRKETLQSYNHKELDSANNQMKRGTRDPNEKTRPDNPLISVVWETSRETILPRSDFGPRETDITNLCWFKTLNLGLLHSLRKLMHLTIISQCRYYYLHLGQ